MAYLIFFTSLFVLFIFTRFRPVSLWWASMRQHGSSSLMLVVAFVVPFLGGAQATASGAIGIPSGIRLLRFFVLILLFLWVSNGIFKRPRCFRNAGAASISILLYALIAMLSATYSVSPVISLWKGFEVLVLVLVGIYIAGELRTLRDIQWLSDFLSFVMLFFVISVLSGVLIAPGLAFAKLSLSSAIVVQGLAPPINSNTLTQFSALLAVLVFIYRLDKNAKNMAGKGVWIIFSIAVVTMLLGHSRTSIFAGILALGGVLFFGRHRALAFVLALGGSLVLLLSEVVENYIYRGQSKELFLSMSGRTHFWEMGWKVFEQAPVLGHGFYAAQRSLMGVSSVDNTYLEVLLGLGLVGLFVFILPVAITAFTLLKLHPRANDSEVTRRVWLQLMVLFVLLFVRSLTGPSFQVMHPNLTMFMMLLVGVAAYGRLIRKGSPEGNDVLTVRVKDTERNHARILKPRSTGPGR